MNSHHINLMSELDGLFLTISVIFMHYVTSSVIYVRVQIYQRLTGKTVRTCLLFYLVPPLCMSFSPRLCVWQMETALNLFPRPTWSENMLHKLVLFLHNHRNNKFMPCHRLTIICLLINHNIGVYMLKLPSFTLTIVDLP